MVMVAGMTPDIGKMKHFLRDLTSFLQIEVFVEK
jgi:hypothetical protein